MTAESWPWVFGSGTGVLGRFGPIRLPFAAIGYRLLRDIVEDSELHCMPNAGIGRLSYTYRYTEEHLLKKAGDGKLNLAGHSQPASHYLRFAALHPDRVGTVLSVAGAHFGSRLASKWPLSAVPCSRDLAPFSEYLLKIQDEFREMLENVEPAFRPRVICFALPGDRRVVDPWHSSLVPGAENVVLARKKPDSLPHRAKWVQTTTEHNHFDVIASRETLGVMAEVVRSRPRISRQTRPRGTRQKVPVAVPVRKAA